MDVSAYTYLVNQRISMFNGCKGYPGSYPAHSAKIITILNAIKSGKWKDYIEWYRQEEDENEREEIKNKFPAVTFSGLFKKWRKEENIQSYTHVLVVDIDKKSMTMSFDKTMESLKSCHFIFAAFESPSGGIKALAFSKIVQKNHKEIFFVGVEEYMRDNFGIAIDPSGKDICRLCFISYDPNLYIEYENKRPFVLKEDAPKTFWESTNKFHDVTNIDYSRFEGSHNIHYIMKKAKTWAKEATGGFVPGSRNNYIFYLSCILNRAGVQMELTERILNGDYPSLKKEVTNAVKSAYKHNKHEFGTRPILEKKKNQLKITDSL